MIAPDAVADELPPLRVPLRFFVTAPLFGLLAALVWITDDAPTFATRWLPGMLAATHLLVLGFLAMVMVGALFQVVPVLGGGAIPWVARIAPPVHAALTAGTLCLAHGLAGTRRGWLLAGVALLGAAFATFLPLLLWRLLRPARGGRALYTVRFAGLGMLATVLLGGRMALAIALPDSGFAFRNWTNAHALTGLCGWVLLLIVGVSYQVVPMFHVTPAFGARVERFVAPTVCIGIALAALGTATATTGFGAGLIAAGAGTWAATALRVLARRKRRADPMVRAWQLAASVLLATTALGVLNACLPGVALPLVQDHQRDLLFGILAVFGVALTIVFGMLGKVVSFLVFTQLQRRCLRTPAAMGLVPTMAGIVGESAARWQLRIHAATTAIAVAAVLRPELTVVAGIATAVDFGWCLHWLLIAVWRHGRALRAIDACAAGSAPAAGR